MRSLDYLAMRWRSADEGSNERAEPGQGALFDEVVERHIGRGEFRGMEFLHVNAQRIINEVPKGTPVPFRFTINAYRGCSHACVYCLAGDTPILMADGLTKPLAEVRVGDAIYGTVRRGNDRRYVTTEVLAHWSTVKPAYRVTLSDGTELVCSGDHRFLSPCGWKRVVRELATGDELVGVDRKSGTKWSSSDHFAPDFGSAHLKVTSIEPLGVELPMFDITTGTGDFIANAVVSHNCFARPTHTYLDLDMGEDFDRKIVVKVNAVERVRAELAPSRWAGHHIAMGTNTDPYQRCEGKYRLTRGIVEALAEARNPFSILTKSTLILRDLDVLTEAARHTDVRANFSIGTLDDEVWRTTEPGTPHPRKRVEALARLNEAGIPCGVLVAPVLPGLSDAPEQLEAVVKACAGAGAVSISAMLLHLRPGVREHWFDWLQRERPDLVDEHERLYPRAYAPKARQEELSRFVGGLVRRYQRGSTSRRWLPDKTAPDAPRPTRAPAARQLPLDL